jgi:ComF family protein
MMNLKDGEYSAPTPGCQPGQPGLVDSLLAWLVPWRCVLCTEPGAGRDLCAGCRTDLPRLGAGCQHCALPLVEADICGGCLGGLPAVDSAIAALLYEYPVAQLIQRLKFGKQRYLARVLADLLVERVQQSCSGHALEQPDVLLPVPLHVNRLAERGFNQAAEIARRIAALTGIRMQPNLVQRIKATPHQARLSRSARLRNLRGAFALSGSVQDQHIVIVDDVITTGATINRLATLLKNAGAARVVVWAVARTP